MAACALALGSLPASAAGVDKLYVLYCGEASATDQSRWSPGVNVGVPIELSDNCYLIHHTQGWFLWDTGLADAVAATPEGVTGANGALRLKRTKTLAAQLDALGVKPADIKGMAISHTHPDHIGNVELFPQVMLFVQKAEYEWPGEGGAPRFKREHPVTKVEGDHDVFGDGSVMIISTPGHTPGHQALLVRLPKTGAVVLSGAGDERQQGADARFDATHRRRRGEGARAALDQSRQAAKRCAEESAGLLRIRLRIRPAAET
jgi:glyoxylase-like metal-dependent hydrolase (beta-lactamase superfamily II)